METFENKVKGIIGLAMFAGFLAGVVFTITQGLVWGFIHL